MKIPEYIQVHLDKHPDAKGIFNRLSPSHKKEYIKWVSEARADDTQKRRLEGMIEMLLKSP
ncbi:MAG: hypothetical protein D6698_00695 [Gammaproteobacteria bacterium]|nr:MAG: hypothetical protein D6698_00695 [Gammaproteobacteria bacterium]